MQGVAFFNEYKRLRMEGGERLGEDETRRRRAEVEFNEGRMWQLLGLMHLAIPPYERCLAMDDVGVDGPTRNDDASADGEDVHMSDVLDDSTHEGVDTPYVNKNRSGLAEPNFKREAAFALQTIYAVGGDLKKARQITEKWLVF